jgi:hypothetical protein
MKYRNRKRKTAIWILEQICKPLKARITGLRDFEGPGSYMEVNEKYYDKYDLKDLIAKNVYSKELLRDAADLLAINDHVEIFENQNNVFDIGIKAYKKGEIALREDIYQDEIDEYNSNAIYLRTRIWLPILALVIAVISLVLSICNQNPK